MIRDGEATGEGTQEAPGRHPQFRDCFSDDTLYTHGQQQPTHYGNDTCASIRINILMDTWERVAGRRVGVSGTQTDEARRCVPRARVARGSRDGRCARKKANETARRRIVCCLW